MMPDFPRNIRIRLARLKKNVASWRCNVRMQQKKILIRPILFLYYEEIWHHQIWIPNYLGFIVLILNCTGKVDWWWCIMNEKLLHLISTTRSAKDHHHILISNLFSGAQCCWCNRQFTTVLKNGKFIGQRSPGDCHHRWYIFQIL